nr:hypothetical protein OG999_02530 [Streptomyces sp. NBC_00886]
MYHHVGIALNLAPAQCLFVDDAPSLVAAATALGHGGARSVATRPPRMCRPSRPWWSCWTSSDAVRHGLRTQFGSRGQSRRGSVVVLVFVLLLAVIR